MKRQLGVLAVTILILSGCGSGDSGGAASASGAAPTPTTAPATADTPVAGTKEIPDPCTLFGDAEVVELTGRQITQIDRDGTDANATTRYCQWQQYGGQLVVFLTRTTKENFDFQKAGSASISGIGDDAYWMSGHLYALVNTLQIDVYATGEADENQNMALAQKVATALQPKVRDFS